jgi:hypothetical protein
MRKLRRVAEAEIIAAFLQNEFHEPEFHRDRKQFESLVMHPDLSDETANAVRRALLFRRRATMWRELPLDTEWWEVELTREDLDRLRVFPRAQWRKIANGSFQVGHVVERIRDRYDRGRNNEFISKVVSLSYELRDETSRRINGSILLIGLDEHSPLTIIEGNHRLTAAVLASPEIAPTRFRFFCGLSPRMSESCWYRTNFANLWRYAGRRLKHLIYDREADVRRIASLEGGHAATDGETRVQPKPLPDGKSASVAMISSMEN